MERRNKMAGGAVTQKRRRRLTVLISFAVVALIITLIVTEQVAILYVLATLSVVALLVVVAWSDLGRTRRATTGEGAPLDDSAVIADGLATATTATSSFGSTAPRAKVRRT